jgi:hypothetical protein
LPRDLSDVLHYFLPELEAADESASSPPAPAKPPRDAGDTGGGEDRPRPPSPWPILALPVGERDVVRAALTWNLAVEIARRGASACVLAPSTEGESPLWPSAGVGPLGTELHLHPAKTPEDLHTAAREQARRSADRTRSDGLVFVCLPPDWLERGEPTHQPFEWWLLLTSSRQRDLQEAYALIRRLLDSNPEIEIGVTIHGVQSIREAREAFERLARACEHRLGVSPTSFGLLVDDLHVYRAIAAQRPIGLEHPQAPATRALMDVARLLHESIGSRCHD